MEPNKTQLCDYGCEQEAKYQFKNGKWCCSESISGCPEIKKKNSKAKKGKPGKPCSKEIKEKKSILMKKLWNDPNSIFNSISYRKKMSKSGKKKVFTKIWKENISKANKFTLKKYKEKYPFLFIIEELRETKNGEIQGHCKNHECKNSKEKGGWFVLTYNQLKGRKDHVCNPDGNGGSYLYCSQHCKDECPLYYLKKDPLKDNNLPYTQTEYQTFRTFVLERDNHICQFCGEPATHVHHERPQKVEPFSALDPDYAWSCCEKCHYEKGHEGECSTGNLAKIVCSVESQKFLNQK